MFAVVIIWLTDWCWNEKPIKSRRRTRRRAGWDLVCILFCECGVGAVNAVVSGRLKEKWNPDAHRMNVRKQTHNHTHTHTPLTKLIPRIFVSRHVVINSELTEMDFVQKSHRNDLFESFQFLNDSRYTLTHALFDGPMSVSGSKLIYYDNVIEAKSMATIAHTTIMPFTSGNPFGHLAIAISQTIDCRKAQSNHLWPFSTQFDKPLKIDFSLCRVFCFFFFFRLLTEWISKQSPVGHYFHF